MTCTIRSRTPAQCTRRPGKLISSDMDRSRDRDSVMAIPEAQAQAHETIEKFKQDGRDMRSRGRN